MGTWGLGVGLGDNPLGFWGWDMGSWGLGVGLGDNPLGFRGKHGNLEFRDGTWGYPSKVWGLGHGNLGFRDGTWGQPFRFSGQTWELGV